MEKSPLIMQMSENERLVLKLVAIGFCIVFLAPIISKAIHNGFYGFLVLPLAFFLAIAPFMFNLNFLSHPIEKWCWTLGCMTLAYTIVSVGLCLKWPGFPKEGMDILPLLLISILGNLVPFVASIVFLFKGYPKT